jgi:hypothetical protein
MRKGAINCIDAFIVADGCSEENRFITAFQLIFLCFLELQNI